MRDRDWLRSQSTRHLIRAAAGVDEGNLTFALLEAGMAVLRIAQLDEDASARDRLLEFLADVKDAPKVGT